MRATEILKRDHDEVKQLFKDFETTSGDDRRQVFERTAAELLVHSQVEKTLPPASASRVHCSPAAGASGSRSAASELGPRPGTRVG